MHRCSYGIRTRARVFEPFSSGNRSAIFEYLTRARLTKSSLTFAPRLWKGISTREAGVYSSLPYDVGPARAFLGEAEKTPCVVLGPASRVKFKCNRSRTFLAFLTKEFTYTMTNHLSALMLSRWIIGIIDHHICLLLIALTRDAVDQKKKNSSLN